VIAYKFLEDGAVGPFTGFRWRIDEWVDAGVVAPCFSGIHACTVKQLPYWLAAELWEIELDGEIARQARKLVAPRGRLVRRHDAWNGVLREAFATDLLVRTRERFGSVPVLSGYVVDIERFRAAGRTGLAAFAAARAAERSAGPRAYERERARQAQWLAQRLGLVAQ
jgi:hypothetical protein